MTFSPSHPELLRLAVDFDWITSMASSPSLISTAYTTEHVKERATHDNQSWWYQTRNKILSATLQKLPPAAVLWDVGCGTGVVSRALARSGRCVIGIEPSPAGAKLAESEEIPIFNSTLENLNLPSNSLNLVGMFDVLEHVENRNVLLNEIGRVLSPGGILIITVPAMPWLWSQFDEDEHHYLRYNRSTLGEELRQHQFEVTNSGYFFFLTVFPLLILRSIPFRLGLRGRLSDSAAVSATGGPFGKLLAFIEQKIALRVPFGSSLLVIARKREHRAAH